MTELHQSTTVGADVLRASMDEALGTFMALDLPLARADRLLLEDLAERVRHDKEITDEELRVAHALMLRHGFDSTRSVRQPDGTA